MKKILVLGATGSIGTSTLDILRNDCEDFVCCGLSANSKKEELERLSAEFSCPSSLTKDEGIDGIKRLLDETKPDIVVNGIAGSAGLLPSMAVLETGTDLALANKETVVMAGPLMFDAAKKSGSRILPVDSEHSAIFTLIHQCKKENLDKIIITASGGPFRTYSRDKLARVKVADALKHPTWNMGVKITIDSASLANKGLEVIEAVRLFDVQASQVQVVVHPQSVIHSLVRTKDGIVYGQFSEPDMKHPILQALDWPEVRHNFMRPFDLTDTADGCRTLTFEKPRMDDFPMLGIAFYCAEKSASYPIVFNAANEIAVQDFIDGRIGFLDIPELVGKVLEGSDWSNSPRDLSDVFEADRLAREMAKKFLRR
ncbi:MAG: 1-deoxy-D-xylulose-5-phosphate reductoisomerase [Treponema sp.]|uniref:1-deoxy-D-xylulose-5-phosphate reductoisomerase n=1 Tax=Treponema sp. TaxID=166 RepID=UPI0025EF3A00|nr:1-deoxy-D-xylulose-5-phosphate reductoisomerase [Treponema sp.]MBQ9281086.1 1-deoxy-D-xylulose-5-phosphate reductoisomerase [Treponema sp.]